MLEIIFLTLAALCGMSFACLLYGKNGVYSKKVVTREVKVVQPCDAPCCKEARAANAMSPVPPSSITDVLSAVYGTPAERERAVCASTGLSPSQLQPGDQHQRRDVSIGYNVEEYTEQPDGTVELSNLRVLSIGDRPAYSVGFCTEHAGCEKYQTYGTNSVLHITNPTHFKGVCVHCATPHERQTQRCQQCGADIQRNDPVLQDQRERDRRMSRL